MASMVEGEPERRLKIAYEEYVGEVGEIVLVPLGRLTSSSARADEEAHVLLIEPRDTVNPGDAGGELTEPERII